MWGKVSALWALFRKGEEVADPEKWKSHQISATVVAGLLLAVINVAKAFGYEMPMDTESANTVGAGVVIIVNWVLTIITSKRAGLPPLVPPVDSPVAQPAAVPEPAQRRIEPADIPSAADPYPDRHGP